MISIGKFILPANNLCRSILLRRKFCIAANISGLVRKNCLLNRQRRFSCVGELFTGDVLALRHADHVEVKWCDRELTLPLSYVWLRDHCRCHHCYDPKTFQRRSDTTDIDVDITPTSTTIHKSMDSSGELHVTWKGGHESVYDLDWLITSTYEGVRQVPPVFPRKLWDRETAASVKYDGVSYRQLVSDDSNMSGEALKQLLQSLMLHGFAFVEECPASVEATQTVCERVSFVRETMFGKMCTFTSDGARSDSAYSNTHLSPHTDTTYLHQASGIQVFHCLHHDGVGGETVLVDGFACSEGLSPEAHHILCGVDVPGEYREEGAHTYHTVGWGPVLTVDRTRAHLIQIRFNPYDRAPLSTVPHDEMRCFYQAYSDLGKLVVMRENQHEVKLTPGTVLFLDNWRVLHGRQAFTGTRQMVSCYLGRDYIESLWRTRLNYMM